MTSQVEIERVLERLGNDWPADSSLVHGVMREIEAQPVRPVSRTPRWTVMKSLLATTASLAALAVLWWTFRGGIADAVFDELVDLKNSVYREERSGLWYAIHRAERFEGGGILVVSSVRGTAETLKQYPLTHRRVRLGLYSSDGPAVNYDASPQGSGFFRIKLASAGHQGIDVCWWVLVPRGTPPTHFDVGDGKIKLPVGITPRGEFAKANFADEHGVIQHLNWDILLDLPQPKSVPTLDEIVRRVYSDQIALEAIPFKRLDMGPKDRIEQFSDPGKTTAAAYSKAVAAHIRWWMENDIEFQLERQFTAESQKQAAQWGAEQVIGLSYESLVDDTTLARIEKRKALKRLHLDGTKITDAGLRHLAGLKQLRVLSLEKTNITDAGIQHVSKLANLEVLSLSHTQITDAGLEHLAGLKQLRELSLEKTNITDAGLKELEVLHSLHTLNVKDTKVTADGIARLTAAIPALQVKR